MLTLTKAQQDKIQYIDQRVTHRGAEDSADRWSLYRPYLTGQSDDYPTHVLDYFLGNILEMLYGVMQSPQHWGEFERRVMTLSEQLWFCDPKFEYFQHRVLSNWAGPVWRDHKDEDTSRQVVACLHKYGVKNDWILDYLAWTNLLLHEENNTPTGAGKYVLEHATQLFALKEPRFLNGFCFQLVQLLARYKPDLLQQHLLGFLNPENYYWVRILKELLAFDYKRYEPAAMDCLHNAKEVTQQYNVLYLLTELAPNKQERQQKLITPERIADLLRNQYTHYYVFEGTNELMVNHAFALLLDRLPTDQAVAEIDNFVRRAWYLDKRLIAMLHERLGDAAYPIYQHVFSKTVNRYNYHEQLLQFLKTIDHTGFIPFLFEQAYHQSNVIRTAVAGHLAEAMGEKAIPRAAALLQDKKGEARLFGALILSQIPSEVARDLLAGALGTEKNDDARDTMLWALQENNPAQFTPEQAEQSIRAAQARGKTGKSYLPFLPLEDMPALYWKHSSEPLDAEAKSYLCYRVSRSKGAQLDPEAKAMLALIDTERGATVSAKLLKGYFDAGHDAKTRWCVLLGAALAGPDEIELLRKKVIACAKGTLRLLAEFIVKALALNGSSRALRWIEYFSRAYKAKNANVGQAAEEAFTLAAEHRGISLHDMADLVIPDFGFEGLFRPFEVKGQTYRAFVDDQFKLAFLNESNKTFKSPPADTPAELKNEFKDIVKELKDIVASQSKRMEYYLVIQRAWAPERWEAFFLHNPVMFCYAVRLVWALYNEENQLIDTFVCQEDQTLMNAAGDEIALPENGSIRMAHPIFLEAGTRAHWAEYLTDTGLQPIFPQMNRPVYELPTEEQQQTILRTFDGVEANGFTLVGTLEKRGWFSIVGENQGYLGYFFKVFSEMGFAAVVEQKGPIYGKGQGGNGQLGIVVFARLTPKNKKGNAFVNAIWDGRDKQMALGDLPVQVYSEVMGDLMYFKENQTIPEA